MQEGGGRHSRRPHAEGHPRLAPKDKARGPRQGSGICVLGMVYGVVVECTHFSNKLIDWQPATQELATAGDKKAANKNAFVQRMFTGFPSSTLRSHTSAFSIHFLHGWAVWNCEFQDTKLFWVTTPKNKRPKFSFLWASFRIIFLEGLANFFWTNPDRKNRRFWFPQFPEMRRGFPSSFSCFFFMCNLLFYSIFLVFLCPKRQFSAKFQEGFLSSSPELGTARGGGIFRFSLNWSGGGCLRGAAH